MNESAGQSGSDDAGLLAALIASSTDAIISMSLDGVILTWNAAATRMYGYTSEEAVGQPLAMVVPKDRAGEDEAILKRLRAGERIDHFQTVRQRKDGSRLEVSLTISPIRDQSGRLRGVSKIARDVTEQNPIQKALGAREALMKAIVDTAVDGIITIDEAGTIESFNPAAERIFGYPQDEVLGRNVNILMPQPYRGGHDGYIRHYLKTGEARIIGIGREVVGRRKDGSTFAMDLAVSEVQMGERRLFAGLVRDISERKAFERQIADLSATEQRRIGQELHDSVGQQVSAIGMLAKSLQKRLAAKDGEADEIERQRAASLVEAVQEAEAQLRALTRGLLPVEVDRNGLMAALDELTELSAVRYERTCTFECDQQVALEDNFTATQLYRIAQEAVHNAAKHAKCESIVVKLAQGGGSLSMSVEDDGVGIDPERVETATGVGMHIMRYRADLIDGMLSVVRREEGGTRVTCVLGKSATER